ncbi:phenylacetyl-CoA ligase [Mycena sp. CBHHK59/15]|nr:phenylacetyl-CoA ligase [Mycena sp. CBHHK59/15]
MAEYVSPIHTLPYFPDDLTLPQFLFEYKHPIRLHRDSETPWIIDSVSGKKILEEELRERTWCLANGFSSRYSLGMSCTSTDFPVTIWAAHRLGASVFALNPTFSVAELIPYLSDMKPAILVVHPSALDAARAAATHIGLPHSQIVLFDLSAVEADQPKDSPTATVEPPTFAEFKLKRGEGKSKTALYFPSSGTTGAPKMAALPHSGIIANIIQNACHDAGTDMSIPATERRFRPGDISCAGRHFGSRCRCQLTVPFSFTILSYMTVVIMPQFDFLEYLSVIKRYKITHLSLVPSSLQLICKHPSVKPANLASVRVVFVGGASVNLHFAEVMASLVPQAIVEQSYGMTEVGGLLTMPPLTRKVATKSAGYLLPGFTARVVKEDGSLAGRGETGELYLSGPSLATHYVNNEKMSSEVFVDGWVRTGDEVYFDDNNEVHVVDRIKDFVKVRGAQVAPAELEAILSTSPDVADCCVVPFPHETDGEVPKAYVVLSKDALERVHKDPAEGETIKATLIKANIADNLSEAKRLSGGIEFIDAIPKTAAGKLLRRVLRAKTFGTTAQSAAPAGNSG